jgi:hypothetical protein
MQHLQRKPTLYLYPSQHEMGRGQPRQRLATEQLMTACEDKLMHVLLVYVLKPV